MRTESANPVFLRLALASVFAVFAGAGPACSLGLPSQDSYFAEDSGVGGALAKQAPGSADSSAEAGDPATAPDADDPRATDGSAPTVTLTAFDSSAGDGASDVYVSSDAFVGRGALDASPEAHVYGKADASTGDSSPSALDAGSDVVVFDAAALGPSVLQLYYSFDNDGGAADGSLADGSAAEAGAAIVPDESGHGLDGLLMGMSPPTTDPRGHLGQGLRLDGTQMQYVILPANTVVGLESMTVTCWINMSVTASWNRVFDFHSAALGSWVYFSPSGWNDTKRKPGTRFAIRTGTLIDPEMELNTTLPTGSWHHVAVILARPYFVYYEDGIEKYRMNMMTMAPKDVMSVQNWLGRSSFPGDPYLSATIDEFRIYSGGLTPQEVLLLAAQ